MAELFELNKLTVHAEEVEETDEVKDMHAQEEVVVEDIHAIDTILMTEIVVEDMVEIGKASAIVTMADAVMDLTGTTIEIVVEIVTVTEI
jgi:hypothetical protein